MQCRLKLDLSPSHRTSETRSERTSETKSESRIERSRISAHTTNTNEIGKLLVVVHLEMHE